MVTQTYQSVSLFSWYMPQNFANRGKEFLQKRKKEDSTASVKIPYYPDEKFTISKHRKNQGNNYAIREPYKGFLPYCADD